MVKFVIFVYTSMSYKVVVQKYQTRLEKKITSRFFNKLRRTVSLNRLEKSNSTE